MATTKIISAIISSVVSFSPVKTDTKVQHPVKNTQAVSTGKVIGIKNRYQGTRVVVRATAYANDPITYTGTVPKVGRTIAVDPRIIPLGSRVYIPQFDQVFIAEDTGSAIKGKRIDIYMSTEGECKAWGIRELEIIILD